MNIRNIAIAAGLFAALATLAACSNSKDARHALESAGYTDIQTTGWSPFSCSEDDTFSTGFIAKNPAGKTVEGTVCSGLFIKGATIRF